MIGKRLFFILFLAVASTPSHAVCSGATFQQEFREADVVVRSRKVSEINAWDDEPGRAFKSRWGEGGPVVLYRLNVMETFKGSPGPRIHFFQERNSGAYYLDADQDYLLFLNYIRPSPGRPTAARGAMYVRYACGQSMPWTKVTARNLSTLRRLTARR